MQRDAVKFLSVIILTIIIAILVISVLQQLITSGLIGDREIILGLGIQSIEALSILGNLGAAALGGLVGWLTRDVVTRLQTKTDDGVPLEAEVASPAAIISAEKEEELISYEDYDSSLDEGSDLPSQEFLEPREDN